VNLQPFALGVENFKGKEHKNSKKKTHIYQASHFSSPFLSQPVFPLSPEQPRPLQFLISRTLPPHWLFPQQQQHQKLI